MGPLMYDKDDYLYMAPKWIELKDYSPEREDRHEIVALVIVLSAILAGILALIIWGFCV